MIRTRANPRLRLAVIPILLCLATSGSSDWMGVAKTCRFDSDCPKGFSCLSWTRPVSCHLILQSSCGIPCEHGKECPEGLTCIKYADHGPVVPVCEHLGSLDAGYR